jgi:cystathionine beta-lyase/cystathionine gamma-synthase
VDLSYILNQLGEDHEAYYGAIAPPVIQTSNFAFRTVAELRAAAADERSHHIYTRGNNPTVQILRQKLAALDQAEDALVFASGMAAISAGVIACLKAGAHAICVQKPYSWTHRLLNDLLARYGVATTWVTGTDVAEIEAAIMPNTALIYLESPNSMTFELQDLAAVAKLAKSSGITTMVDNSYASPLNQQPAALGIDLVAYSATKYHNGHSDVVAGVLSGPERLLKPIFNQEYLTLGGIAAPWTAWLMLRSLRTLHLRMAHAASTTPQVIAFLEQQPIVKRIIYPHHPSHPQHALAVQQMKRPAGLFSIILDTDDVSKIERFCNSLKRFLLACSWGGHESLVYPACVFCNPNDSGAVPFNLVRFYIGLEEPEVLIADIKQALQAAF